MTDSTKLTELAHRINQLLPQTQCTKCGYAGCRPYAEAIAQGTASYNQCPPGGQEGIERLATLLHKPMLTLNPENGAERPRPRAVIDETLCIGCTLCIQACPVDAIVGAPKQMHTVVAELCTGCDLCVPPCPVDCITMVPVTGQATGWQAWSQEQAEASRRHYEQRVLRLEQNNATHQAKTSAKSEKHRATPLIRPTPSPSTEPAEISENKQALVQAALARAREHRQALQGANPSTMAEEKK